jgi:hypothetical protein
MNPCYSLRRSKPDAANAAANVAANAVDIVDDAERYDNANVAYAAYAANIVDDAAKRDAKRDVVYPSCYIFSFPISSSGRRMNQNNYTIF